jgi:hypothetical protein
VHLGREALEALSDLDTTPDDAPLPRVRIAKWAALQRAPPARPLLPAPDRAGRFPERGSFVCRRESARAPARAAGGRPAGLLSRRAAAPRRDPPRRQPSVSTPHARTRKNRCGATNALGTHDTLDDAVRKETAAQAAERLAAESKATKASIMWGGGALLGTLRVCLPQPPWQAWGCFVPEDRGGRPRPALFRPPNI